MLLPFGLPGGVTAVVCVLLVRAPLLRSCLRCLVRASLAAQPGALPPEPRSGGACLRFCRDQGRMVGLARCMDEWFFWPPSNDDAPHRASTGGLETERVNALRSRPNAEGRCSSLQNTATVGRSQVGDAAVGQRRSTSSVDLGHLTKKQGRALGFDRGAAPLEPAARPTGPLPPFWRLISAH